MRTTEVFCSTDAGDSWSKFAREFGAATHDRS
jgi:hypothetical protein